ncbi:MAG: alpha/beta hydrolase-fold protein [Chitinophagaceae bacterium]
MKHLAAAIIISMVTVNIQAQLTLQIKSGHLPSAPTAEAIYVAGNFNGWNPKDENFRLQKEPGGGFGVTIKNMEAGTYAFKCTRGSWDNVETGRRGEEISNRSITLSSDTVLSVTIAGWKDGFAQPQKTSTASAQVIVVDEAFAIPQLGRSRRIWVYLPKDYAQSTKKFPVLYMQDGQNLFDDATAFAGEWGVDEAMDAMENPCIVVGIDNGGEKRMNEYNPNNTRKFGKGEGKEYLSFIVNNLKPFIDKKYRTLQDREHTAIAGSSMGGLISFYAGLYYPNTFGTLGILSPSFWIAPQIKTQVKQLAKEATHGSQHYYFYAGGLEEKATVKDMQAVAAELKKSARPGCIIIVNPGGKHNEADWAAVFPAFYKWMRER